MKRTPSQEMVSGYNASIARIRDRAALVRRHRVAINKIARVVRAQTGGVPYMTITAEWDDKGPYECLRVTARMPNLDGFRDRKLVNALVKIEDKLLVEFNKTQDSFYSESPNREFIGTLVIAEGLRAEVKIDAFVRTDSPTCRKIVKSMTMQEVPEYEIVCE